MNNFIKVATLSDLPAGGKRVVEYDEEEVGLINYEGQVYAISNICTHDDGPLMEGELDGECIVCPRHGARFNFKTGDYTLPAFAPVPRYRVKVEGEDILIAPME